MESSEGDASIPTTLVLEMDRQLNSWRSLLPEALRWHDADALGERHDAESDSESRSPTFSYSNSSGSAGHSRNTDMLTAQLRTRYYYARYILYRPYIYKALHHPLSMSRTDADYCGVAVKSMCLWPSLMAPPKAKKRTVPHLYAWTHNCLGMLLIFHSISRDTYFQRICEQTVSADHVQQTSAMMLEWIRDVKQVDGTAEWAWKILGPLFNTNDD